MPVAMSDAEMKALAQKLAKMRFTQAKVHVRNMDKHAHLDLFRVVIDQHHLYTRYALPTLDLLVTLIEEKEEYGNPSSTGLRQTRFKFLEARVESLPPDRQLGEAIAENQALERNLTPPR